MSFTHPIILFALLIPAALLVWLWRRPGRRVVVPFDHGLQGKGTFWAAAINIAESLVPCLLAVVIIMLAGPQRLSEPRTKRRLTNIQFCVDISGSMTARFGEGTRYDASMAAINEFLDARQGDAFGLTFFGNNYLHWTPLTSDASAIRCATPFMRPEVVPNWFGGTEIAKALLACREVLVERQEGDRMIILVSDGSSGDLMNGNDEEVARRLRADEITVFGIHIGGGDPPEPIVRITSMTGGEVFAPGDPGGLDSVFQRIDTMKEVRLDKIQPESMDWFEPFCLIGLSLMGVVCVCGLGLRYTPW